MGLACSDAQSCVCNKEGCRASPSAPPHDPSGTMAEPLPGRELSAAGPGGEVALVYMTIALTIGALVSHGLSRLCPTIQYTPTLLIIGVLTSVVGQYTKDQYTNTFALHLQRSLEEWEAMDGHMILFVFLPPLLFADSMHLQWALVRRCFGQCALLAGPGVALGAVLNGLFAKLVLPYDWPWAVCWSYGAVQAATDPVAVVALLNQLGASPALTMIISGERSSQRACDLPRERACDLPRSTHSSATSPRPPPPALLPLMLPFQRS
jgi:hypothetical protein